MKMNVKGQITIPPQVRRFLNITPDSELDFKIEGEGVTLVHVPSEGSTLGTVTSRYRTLRGSRPNALTSEEWMKVTRGANS